MKSVYSAVRTGALNKAVCGSALEELIYWDDNSHDTQKIRKEIYFFYNFITKHWKLVADGGAVG
jgi:hypothetical protein